MTTTKTIAKATWIDCPGVVTDGRANHSMRDGCWSCAPWWERIPTCPTDGTKLQPSRSRRLADDGSGYYPNAYCRTCRRHFDASREG